MTVSLVASHMTDLHPMSKQEAQVYVDIVSRLPIPSTGVLPRILLDAACDMTDNGFNHQAIVATLNSAVDGFMNWREGKSK